MNHKIKFHKPNGPAFKPGEEWVDSSGNKCVILSIAPFCDGAELFMDDWDVTYKSAEGLTYSKDAWNFQVRYSHVADQNL